MVLKVLFEINLLAKSDVGFANHLAIVACNHAKHITKLNFLGRAHDLGRHVADLQKSVVVDCHRDQVQICPVSLQRGKVGLTNPFNAYVGDRWLCEPPTSHPFIVLEHYKQRLRQEDFSDDRLGNIAFLHRLVARTANMDVADTFEKTINGTNSGRVF